MTQEEILKSTIRKLDMLWTIHSEIKYGTKKNKEKKTEKAYIDQVSWI